MPKLILVLFSIPIIIGTWFVIFYVVGIIINIEWVKKIKLNNTTIGGIVDFVAIAFLILVPALTSEVLEFVYHKMGLLNNWWQ